MSSPADAPIAAAIAAPTVGQPDDVRDAGRPAPAPIQGDAISRGWVPGHDFGTVAAD